MTEIKIGSIAKSKAGRDKNLFLVVLDIKGKYAFVCNGKQRPIEKAKKKKLIHLAPTNTVLDINNLKNNKVIRRELGNFSLNLDERC